MPQRSITHLTLIAGFASTLFWPLTTLLHEHLGWREVLRRLRRAQPRRLPADPCLARAAAVHAAGRAAGTAAAIGIDRRCGAAARHVAPVFLLMLAGFAIEGFVLSAILVHMVPLTAAVGLGTAGVFVASLFGPSQVASRLINMLFGGGLRQTWLALGRDRCCWPPALSCCCSARPRSSARSSSPSCSASAPAS